MVKRPPFIYRFFTIGLTILFICTSLMPETLAYALPRHPAVRYYRPHVRPFLPLGFALLTIAGIEYYYHRGIYYRPLPDGYVVTTPPVGAVVIKLPPGHITFRSGGIEYYYYGNVYYNKVPSGYIVVNPPYETSTASSIPEYQSASPMLSQAKVTSHMLNVRSGPGMDHAITFQVSQGTILEIHGTAPEWLFVKLPSGEFGWVMKKFTVSDPASNPVPAEG
ncbi:MAG: SH3 domain-containing protein [Dehalococcoidales bacterium]|nr:SH3 domain-containing protein [Dehalococcoidales bacterium]